MLRWPQSRVARLSWLYPLKRTRPPSTEAIRAAICAAGFATATIDEMLPSVRLPTAWLATLNAADVTELMDKCCGVLDVVEEDGRRYRLWISTYYPSIGPNYVNSMSKLTEVSVMASWTTVLALADASQLIYLQMRPFGRIVCIQPKGKKARSFTVRFQGASSASVVKGVLTPLSASSLPASSTQARPPLMACRKQPGDLSPALDRPVALGNISGAVGGGHVGDLHHPKESS